MITFDDKTFNKDLTNILNYSIGFLEGVELGRLQLMKAIGKMTIKSMKDFVDSNARVNPQALHHIYEWYETGSPEARLYDLTYIVSGNNSLSFNYTFSQSKSLEQGSTVPFYNKAEIMEKGIPVIIRPQKAKALHFQVDGQDVFSKSPITVNDPGGMSVQGSFEKTLNDFFSNYFSQSFLESSGLKKYLESPDAYKKNLRSGKSNGKVTGVRAGKDWITKAGGVLE